MRRIHSPTWPARWPAVLVAALLALLWASVSIAAPQGDDDDDDLSFDPVDVNEPTPPVNDTPEPEPVPGSEEPDPDLNSDLQSTDKPVKAGQETKLKENRASWQDIVVVVRKPFLKVSRFEVLPLFGITMNDNIIQHLQGGLQLNYYLTDVLAVGFEAAGYLNNLREPFDLVARQARRLPTVNKYNFSGALNFHYVPVYGKFAVLDRHIVHWESYFTAGVGVTQSEVIPRDPQFLPFSNFLITPNVGLSMRFFLTKFITVNVGVRDYIFVDKYEAPGRTERQGDVARENATSALVNNVMFQAGVALWFPMSFDYTTFR